MNGHEHESNPNERPIESWKQTGCCREFPQQWTDFMWGLEFENTRPEVKAFRTVGASVCQWDCPVRYECLAYAASGGLEWGLYGGKSCTDRRQIARIAETDGVPCRDRTLSWTTRWKLLVNWLKKHPDVLNEAQRQASAERGARRARKREHAEKETERNMA